MKRRSLIGWLSSFSVTRKLVVIYLLDLMVTASIIVSYVNDKSDQIDFSALERDGTAIFTPAQALYRLLIDNKLNPGDADQLKALAAALAQTEQTQAEHGQDMALTPEWSALANAAKAYDQASPGDHPALFQPYQDKLGVFLAAVGDRSNLILDPDLDSYYAMAITVVHMPAAIRTIIDLSDSALMPGASKERSARLFSLDGGLRRIQADIARSLKAGAGGNPDGLFDQHLAAPGETFLRALSTLSAVAQGEEGVASARASALSAGFAFWQAATSELNRLIDLRIEKLYHQMILKLGITFTLALGVLAAVTFIGRQITRPVHELASVAKQVGSRNQRRAQWESADEFGALVITFNDMLDRLALEGKRREEMAAAAKAAEAQRDLLKAIPLPVLVTSLDGSRTLNANEAAQALFNETVGETGAGLSFLNPDTRQTVISLINAGGAIDEVEVECRATAGQTSVMVMSGRAVTYHGEKVALFGLTPVNELKRTQTALSEAKEAAEINANRLRAITETVMASIRYASRIQRSIFPDAHAVRRINHGLDIWVEQRDVVGGDWHWVESFEDGDLVFLCDCTGHGVPGALMTMLVSACFRRVIDDRTHDSPAEILRSLHRLVRSTLVQGAGGGSTADDGLDAVCLFLERRRNVARIASARLPLVHASSDGLHEIKGDRMSLGYPSQPEELSFTDRIIPVQEGDLFYLYTDGLTDQVGGDKRVMFGRRRLLQAIEEVRSAPPADQIEHLRETLANYRSQEAVRDDSSLLILRVMPNESKISGGKKTLSLVAS